MGIAEGVKKFFKEENEIKLKISDFENLNFIEKNEKIRDIIKQATGFRNSINSRDLLNIIDYIEENKNEEMIINKELVINNIDGELIIKYRKGKVYLNVILFVIALILIAFLGTYAYLFKERLLTVNKDIDGDGIPEVNIDKDGDGVADINIDLDGDDIPDYNINYRKNGNAIFNIKEGKKYKNTLNQDLNNDKTCDLNCDINEDGWPDTNLDMNGDGVADLFIDSEYKGYATLNIDINGDKTCDINCDLDDDFKCDKNCLDFEVVKYIDIKNASAGVDISTVIPILELDGNEIDCKNLFPTDQPQDSVLKECKADFTVKNMSGIGASYNLKLAIDKNSFISDNLKYKLTSDNKIASIPNYVTVPKETKTVLKNIKIDSYETHHYSVSFIIEGENEEQNYDAGKNLKLKFIIEI